MSAGAKLVACPRCGALAAYAPGNRWRPFCSERCRLIDLGNWAAEAYRVPVPPQADGEAANELPPEPDRR